MGPRRLSYLLLVLLLNSTWSMPQEGVKNSDKYPIQTRCMTSDIPGTANSKSVTCYNALPSANDITPQVTELLIKKFNIDSLTRNTIRNLRLPNTLTTIRFQDCSIRTLEANVFDSLPNLRVIDLSRNSISQIPANLFSYTTGVQKIYLSNNALESIPDNCFSTTSNLEVLNLNENRLQNVPSSLPLGLTHLYLLNNNIRRLQHVNLPNLNELNVCGNQISFFPQNVVGYPKLQKLCIGSAQLAQGSDGFQSLTDLQELTVDGSGVQDAALTLDATSSISKCTRLQTLNIRSYRINSLNFITTLQDLKQLQLRRVSIDRSGMPKSSVFRSCPNLQILDLSESRELAQTLLYDQDIKTSFQQLRYLIVRDCGLTNLAWFPLPPQQTPTTPMQFPQLAVIDVSRNRLNCQDNQTYRALCYLNRMSSNFSAKKDGTQPRIVNKGGESYSQHPMVIENTDETMCYDNNNSRDGERSVMRMDFSNCTNETATTPVRPVPIPGARDNLPTPEEQQGLTGAEIWYIVLGVLLVIFLVLVIVLVVVCCIKKRRRGAEPIGKLEDGRDHSQAFSKLKEGSSEDTLLGKK